MHTLPSVQAVPFALGTLCEHRPVILLQVPASLHWSPAGQVGSSYPVHTPLVHMSVAEHALPSLQLERLDLAGLEQVPVAALQVPATWH